MLRRMLAFTLRRLAVAVPTLLAIATASFFLMRAAPGGPFDAEANLDPEVLENLYRTYGLDQPLLEQYRIYLANVLKGDFGPSLVYEDFNVTELIAIGLRDALDPGTRQ